MKFKVIRGVLLRNGARYVKGSVFDAEESEVAWLISQKYVVPDLYHPVKNTPLTVSGNQTGDQISNGDDSEMVEAPTIEEFSELKAEEQKAILADLGFEPGSNKEERVAQYEAWYSQQPSDDEPNAELLDGEQVKGDDQV